MKGMPPVVKLLLLDDSPDSYAYPFVKHIINEISIWEMQNQNIARTVSFLDSIRNAITRNKINQDIVFHFCYGLTKAYYLNLQKNKIIRPTFLTISQMSESILRFSRTLEDFIRTSPNFQRKESINNCCVREWFPSDNWKVVKNYIHSENSLIIDFLNNNWKLSKDSRNLLFSIKFRNCLAHSIPTTPLIFQHYIEIILAIASSFGYVCDRI